MPNALYLSLSVMSELFVLSHGRNGEQNAVPETGIASHKSPVRDCGNDGKHAKFLRPNVRCEKGARDYTIGCAKGNKEQALESTLDDPRKSNATAVGGYDGPVGEDAIGLTGAEQCGAEQIGHLVHAGGGCRQAVGTHRGGVDLVRTLGLKLAVGHGVGVGGGDTGHDFVVLLLIGFLVRCRLSS